MVNQDIVRYFREGIDRGFSIQSLKKNLLDNGFHEQEINDAINALPAPHKNKAESLEKIDHHIETHKKEMHHERMQMQHEKKMRPEKQHSGLGVFSKIGKAFAHPKNLFNATQSEGTGSAIKYWFVISIIPLIISIISGFLLSAYVASYFAQLGLSAFAGSSVFIIVLILTGIVFVSLYIVGLILMFVMAGLLHMFVKLFKGSGTYANTFAVNVYSSTPSVILGFIPIVNFITAIWSLILSIVGLSVMHKISKVKSFFAILLTWIVLGGLIALIFYIVTLFF